MRMKQRLLCLLLTLALVCTLAPGQSSAAWAAEISSDTAAEHDTPQTVPQAGSHTVQLLVKLASNCRIYYNERISGQDWSPELREVKQGETISHTGLDWPYGIILFAAPETGYSLSAMTADNSKGDYFTISDGEKDGTGCEFLKNPANYKNLIDKAGYTEEGIRQMVALAIAQGCDGAMLFSRSSADSGNVKSTLRFYAEQLPTLDKQIASVTPKGSNDPQPFVPGMSVGLGDIVTFDLEVTFSPLTKKDSPITYTDIYILDEMTGNGADNPIPVTPPAPKEQKTMNKDKVITHSVKYIITQEDVERGGVANQAQLHYEYQSGHSKGKLETVTDARADISVHASVTYQYTSGTDGMELPPELTALTPADNTFHAQDSSVSVLGHMASSPYRDEATGGYWTLQNGGAWSSNISGLDTVPPNGSFTMPASPVVLTAVWNFTGDPALSVEKDGNIKEVPDSDKVNAGDPLTYTAAYTVSIKNTGGEGFRQFTVWDNALSEDVSISATVDGVAVNLENMSRNGQTCSFSLPQGLEPGRTLMLAYSPSRTGTLGMKKELADESQVAVTATGVSTGLAAKDEDDLSMVVALENRIMLQPADIIIYAGGDKDGENVTSGTNLPEPAIYITLSFGAEQALRAETGDTEQVDLSQYLTFTDGSNKVWRLKPFADGESKSHGRLLYQLVSPEGESGFRLQFYDEKADTYIQQSEFDITNALQQEYDMSFNSEDIQGTPQAVLKVGDKEIDRYDLGVTPGKLSIRGTTKHLTTSNILNKEPEEAVSAISAYVTRPDTTYYLNDTELPVAEENVELLVDQVVDPQYNDTLKSLAQPVLSSLKSQNQLLYQFQYMDLVDVSRGNAWVTSDAPLEVFWPYPAGTGAEDNFTIIHYKGLDRNYDLSDMADLALGTDYTLEVYTTGAIGGSTRNVTYHTLTAGEQGLSLTLDGFSPFALVWEGDAPSSGGDAPDYPSDQGENERPERPKKPEKPEEPKMPVDLYTADHYAYLVGRGGGGIQPLEAITRAEVATVFFRLLTNEARAAHWTTDSYYPDVDAQAWYHNTVATMTNMGVMVGDQAGLFRPDDPITRAEFVMVAVRFFPSFDETVETVFPDVPADAWYAGAVSKAVALGLITGRDDGTFAPEDSITRAEAAAILNRVLGRRPHEGQLLEDVIQWVDNPPEAWYYEDMLEASVSHSYEWSDKTRQAEIWTGHLEEWDWTMLERKATA